MKSKGYVITIDGLAGSGKSTLARRLADLLGYRLLDSGALYRAVALSLLRKGVEPGAETIPSDALADVRIDLVPNGRNLEVLVDGILENERLREEHVGNAASGFATFEEVRSILLDLQRGAANKGAIVAEGRDMGTVVFPDARKKFFITASLDERVRRRAEQLDLMGKTYRTKAIYKQMRQRDLRDSTRSISPLKPAKDAILINTDNLGPDQAIERMLSELRPLQPILDVP